MEEEFPVGTLVSREAVVYDWINIRGEPYGSYIVEYFVERSGRFQELWRNIFSTIDRYC